MVHALVFQVAGTKRWLLATEDAVEAAVGRGAVPPEVLWSGETHHFLVEGTLASVYGVDDDDGGGGNNDGGNGAAAASAAAVGGGGARCPRLATRAVAGGVAVTLRAGDCLLVPAGLFHDVQADQSPALSVTVRFSLPGPRTPAAAAQGSGEAPSPEEGGSEEAECPGACPRGGGGSRCGRPRGHWGAHHDGGSPDAATDAAAAAAGSAAAGSAEGGGALGGGGGPGGVPGPLSGGRAASSGETKPPTARDLFTRWRNLPAPPAAPAAQPPRASSAADTGPGAGSCAAVEKCASSPLAGDEPRRLFAVWREATANTASTAAAAAEPPPAQGHVTAGAPRAAAEAIPGAPGPAGKATHVATAPRATPPVSLECDIDD
jgi:hypothetical protein